MLRILSLSFLMLIGGCTAPDTEESTAAEVQRRGEDC